MVPTIGRIVQVCIDEGDNGAIKPQWRPAIVVQDWGATNDGQSINVQVFVDGPNDARYAQLQIEGEDGARPLWLTSVTKGDGLRNWRWPPRVD